MAISISNLVSVTIRLIAATVTRSTFGNPAVFAEFLATKTNTPFTRTRFYANLTEASDDGWAAGDAVYDALEKIFGQEVKPAKAMVGRIDAGDADVAEALTAALTEESDWYAFMLVGYTEATATLSADLITANVISSTVNGISVADVTYATSHAATMSAWETAIETALSGSTATATGQAMKVVLPDGEDVVSIEAAVTLGATQPSVVSSYAMTQQPYLDAAAWVATQTRIFGVTDPDVNTLSSGSTTDLAYKFKNLAYNRTFVIFHEVPSEYAVGAWMGLELTKDPGQSTWAIKTLIGITPSPLTQTQFDAAKDKNASLYVTMGGNNVTLYGTLASGDPIATRRNLDYAESEIQADLMELKVSRDIIPYNDSGINLEENTLRGTVSRMETEGIFVPGQSTTTAPKFADIPPADVAAEKLEMEFTAKVQHAIIQTDVAGTVTN